MYEAIAEYDLASDDINDWLEVADDILYGVTLSDSPVVSFLKRIKVKLVALVERIDDFVDEEIEFVRCRLPYSGRHNKRRVDPCGRCLGASFGDCEECDRIKGGSK